MPEMPATATTCTASNTSNITRGAVAMIIVAPTFQRLATKSVSRYNGVNRKDISFLPLSTTDRRTDTSAIGFICVPISVRRNTVIR